MFWIISDLNKLKGQFSDHILYSYNTNLYVYHRPNNQPNDMWKHLSLMIDCSKNNDGYISFFKKYFSTHRDLALLPDFPLVNNF